MIAPLSPAAAAGGFQLPPGQSSSPRPQGPVDAGEPPPRVVRPAPTPTPAPAPVPVVTAPEAAPTVAVPAPSASAPPRPAASAQPGQVPAATPSAVPAGQPTPAPSFNPLAQDRPPVAEASESPVAEPAAAAPAFTLPAWWPLAAGGAALAAILGALTFLLLRWRQRRAEEAPEIERPVVVERPVVAPQAAPPPPPPPPPPEEDDAHGPLSIAVEAREMTISFGAATLSYRITLTNTGSAPLGHVAISGDMISAHASLTLEDQIANTESVLAPAHEIERIKPGESVQVTGEFRLPVQSIRAIRKGNAALFVPLARLRVQAGEGGNGALIRTALVGQRAANPGAGLQPFRLDLGPRIYREVTQKIF